MEFNPLFPGLDQLSNLGIGNPEPVGQGMSSPELTKSVVDSAISAWRQKYIDAVDATKAPAPVPEGSGGATLASIVASILAGATGAGVQASGVAQDVALSAGGAVIDARNEMAAAQHAAKIKAAADQLKSMEDVSSGVRMLLQAQPKLFTGDMMRLASEIAFPGTGLSLTPEAGMNHGTKSQVDALDFIIKSNDVKDAGTLANMHNMRYELVTGRKMKLVNGQSFMDPDLGVNPQFLFENAINGKEFWAEYQRTGVMPDVNKIDWKASIKLSYTDAVLTALQRWAEFQVKGGMSKREALDALATEHPDDRVLLEERFGPTRVGGMVDLETAGDIALRTYLRQGETGQVLEGGLGEPEFYNDKLGDYLDKEVERRQKNTLALITQAHDDLSAKLQQEEGMSEEDADEAAVEQLKKMPRFKSLVREMIPEFKQQLSEEVGW